MKKRICAGVLAVIMTVCALLGAGFARRGDDGIETVVTEFMAEHGLTEKNFSFGYYDTVTGEEWYYNGDKLMIAASMYKLPLNMLYAEMIRDGTISPEQMIGGYPLEKCMYMSIVNSDNEISVRLQQYISPVYREHKARLTKFFDMEPEDMPDEFYRDNYSCPRYLITALKHLYDDPDTFETLIGYMKIAHPGRYFQKNDVEYEIAHKYGYLDGMINDCGIVFTPSPFLIVAFTKNVSYGEDVLGQLCETITEYNLKSSALPLPKEVFAMKAKGIIAIAD